jgi:hypothetical protein
LATRRVTLKEAAEILGVSKEAVRKRVIRKTLRSDTGEDGRRYVYLDVGGDEPTTHEPDALISEMRERISYLEGLVETRDEEIRRRDAIIMNMTEAMKALSPPTQEAPSDERESPETVEEAPERAEPWSAAGGAREGVQRRPWWRRVFGG